MPAHQARGSEGSPEGNPFEDFIHELSLRGVMDGLGDEEERPTEKDILINIPIMGHFWAAAQVVREGLGEEADAHKEPTGEFSRAMINAAYSLGHDLRGGSFEAHFAEALRALEEEPGGISFEEATDVLRPGQGSMEDREKEIFENASQTSLRHIVGTLDIIVDLYFGLDEMAIQEEIAGGMSEAEARGRPSLARASEKFYLAILRPIFAGIAGEALDEDVRMDIAAHTSFFVSLMGPLRMIFEGFMDGIRFMLTSMYMRGVEAGKSMRDAEEDL